MPLEKLKRFIIKSEFYLHETKRSTIRKFLSVLGVVLAYFLIISWRYGFSDGVTITTLTWAFFVLCTPIADAGFLLDFPIRIFTGLRMVYMEIFVWCTAFLLVSFNLFFNNSIYDVNAVLKLFKYILLHPYPYWIIIFMSCVGTFLSLFFADELVDVSKHRHRSIYIKHKTKYHLLILAFLLILILIVYDFLLIEFGINIF